MEEHDRPDQDARFLKDESSEDDPASEDATPLVQADQLTVTFGRQNVLRNLTLEVPRGQTLAIIGESGCGKTVLLKCIIALVKPTSGMMHFDGRDLSTLNDRDLTAQRQPFWFLVSKRRVVRQPDRGAERRIPPAAAWGLHRSGSA